MGTLRLAPATVSDYRRLAESRLPRQLFDYIDGGAVDERTLAANREDLARLRLRQRVLRDVSQVETAAEIAGHTAAMPVAFAPRGPSRDPCGPASSVPVAMDAVGLGRSA